MEPSTTARPITIVEQTNFAVSDDGGDMVPGSYHGFFAADTRFLSRFVLRLDGSRLERLSAAVGEHQRATFYLANPRVAGLRAASVAVFRDRRIGRGLEERIRLISYRAEPIQLQLSIEVDADFADIFEARGARRRRRRVVTTEHTDRHTVFTYENAGYRRTTQVTFSRPIEPTDHRLNFDLTLEHGRPWDLNVTVSTTRWSRRGVPPLPPERTIAPRQVQKWRERIPIITSSDVRIERAWRQAGRDMVSLLLSGPRGDFLPAAGVPWYLAVFGRDACITALQTPMLGPEISHGTLRQLAAYQGSVVDPWREEEPGKIPHEVRTGELATLGRMPFSRYYGSSDATPLYVMLFVAACRWGGWLTGGRAPRSKSAPPLPAPLSEFLPAVERALAWIDDHTDADGLLRYRPHHKRGIVNQVWKDSWDSMRYSDGSIAAPPIAAVEVQGYVVAARRGMGEVFAALGRPADALRQETAAALTTAAVEESMWMADEGTYALGLDADGRQIGGVASNAGHLLWCGVPTRARARAVAERLMAPDMFSGWGVRTLSNANPGYNPIGYHTGSVWPHDNSLIAAGMAAYGQHRAAWRVIDALLDAAVTDPQARLPELYAGFDRRSTPHLVPYPTACAPQAWATGAVVLAVQTMLGASPGNAGARHLPGAPSLGLKAAADPPRTSAGRAAPRGRRSG
ncbi:MAG: glycogen debranching N-terminal domain-containing protein [Chloroflexota bacterium]